MFPEIEMIKLSIVQKVESHTSDTNHEFFILIDKNCIYAKYVSHKYIRRLFGPMFNVRDRYIELHIST